MALSGSQNESIFNALEGENWGSEFPVQHEPVVEPRHSPPHASIGPPIVYLYRPWQTQFVSNEYSTGVLDPYMKLNFLLILH